MKLSQSVMYAIQASLHLAATANLSLVSCGELAEQGNMPERFLLQILRDLAKQGILQSARGGGGGFRLVRRAEEVSLLDIMEAIDGPLASRLPVNSSFPEQPQIVLWEVLSKISDTTRRQLGALKLSHLLNPQESEAHPVQQHAEELPGVAGATWPIVDRVAG